MTNRNPARASAPAPTHRRIVVARWRALLGLAIVVVAATGTTGAAGAGTTCGSNAAPATATGTPTTTVTATGTATTTASGTGTATTTPPVRPPVIEDLTGRLDLRGPFNLGRGKVRVVTFLSPTCKHCIANAAHLQEILRTLPGDDVEVHAVWLQIMDSDDRNAVARATTVLRDARVHHYWDPKRVLNHQLLDAIAFDVQIRLYDVFLLYDRDAMWDKRLPPPGFWMHEYPGVPGPVFDAAVFAAQIAKAQRGESLGTPR